MSGTPITISDALPVAGAAIPVRIATDNQSAIAGTAVPVVFVTGQPVQAGPPMLVTVVTGRPVAAQRPIPVVLSDIPCIYVSKTGNNANNGTDITRPVATITQANTLANANAAIQEIRILPGVYQEQVNVPRNNVTYRALGALGSVVIDGANKTLKAIYTANFSNITVVGIAAQNCAFAFDFRGGTNVRFIQCSVSNSLRGFYAIGAIRPALSGCVVTGTTDAGAGFWLTSNTQDALIESCEAYACAARGFYANASPRCVFRDCYCHDQAGTAYGFEAEAAAHDCQFIRCWFVGNGTTNQNGIIAKTSSRVRMDGCVVSGCVSAGLYHKGAVDSMIYNCVAASCLRNIYLANDGATLSSGSIVKNNVILSGTTYGFEIVSGNAVGAAIDYNDYYGNATLAAIGATPYTFATWQGLGYEAHGETNDPAYGGSAFPDGYGLPAAPLRNAGVYLGGTDLTPDIGRTGSQWDGYGYI